VSKPGSSRYEETKGNGVGRGCTLSDEEECSIEISGYTEKGGLLLNIPDDILLMDESS